MMTDLERFIYLPYMMTFRNISWHNYNCGGSRGFNPPPPQGFFFACQYENYNKPAFSGTLSLGFGGFVSPALAKAKLGCSRHCHKSVCMYVCVSGCPRSPFSPKLLDQILPKLTGGCSRTSRCALLQMILI